MSKEVIEGIVYECSTPSLDQEAARFLPCMYITCSLEATWCPQVSFPARNVRDLQEYFFSDWGGGEQPSALSLTWPPKPFCACSLVLLAPLMLTCSDLILSYSLCLAMVVWVTSSASLAGLMVPRFVNWRIFTERCLFSASFLQLVRFVAPAISNLFCPAVPHDLKSGVSERRIDAQNNSRS